MCSLVHALHTLLLVCDDIAISMQIIDSVVERNDKSSMRNKPTGQRDRTACSRAPRGMPYCGCRRGGSNYDLSMCPLVDFSFLFYVCVCGGGSYPDEKDVVTVACPWSLGAKLRAIYITIARVCRRPAAAG
jgi:hypothetical protein